MSDRTHQTAAGLFPWQYLILGRRVTLPIPITELSFVLGSLSQPARLMAAAPVKQRSGPGGPRAQLPPCYYEGYLEKRGPKEKVCDTIVEQLPCSILVRFTVFDCIIYLSKTRTG